MIVGAPELCQMCEGPCTYSGHGPGSQEPNPIITVMFRRDRTKDGDVTAVMPLVDEGNYMCRCYAHIGQHSACARSYIYSTRPATPDEYAPLLKELTSAPYFYRFRIVQRWPKHGTPMEG